MIILQDGRIGILKGYKWDGFTPKICIADIYFGTPDGSTHPETGKPRTYYGSPFHDVLYEFYKAAQDMDHLAMNPIYSPKDADMIFLDINTIFDFIPRKLYHGVVRLLGRITQLGKRPGRKILVINPDDDLVREVVDETYYVKKVELKKLHRTHDRVENNVENYSSDLSFLEFTPNNPILLLILV